MEHSSLKVLQKSAKVRSMVKRSWHEEKSITYLWDSWTIEQDWEQVGRLHRLHFVMGSLWMVLKQQMQTGMLWGATTNGFSLKITSWSEMFLLANKQRPTRGSQWGDTGRHLRSPLIWWSCQQTDGWVTLLEHNLTFPHSLQVSPNSSPWFGQTKHRLLSIAMALTC